MNHNCPSCCTENNANGFWSTFNLQQTVENPHRFAYRFSLSGWFWPLTCQNKEVTSKFASKHCCVFMRNVCSAIKMDSLLSLSVGRPPDLEGKRRHSSSFRTEVVMVRGSTVFEGFRPERNRKWLFIFLISSLRLQ